MTENEAIKSDEELGCELACKVIAQVNEKSIEFEAKMMDVALKRWGYCKYDVEKALLELEQYRKLGTFEEVGEAVEKTKEKKPVVHKNTFSDAYTCPTCNLLFIYRHEKGWFCGKHYSFCPDCGQKIDWSDG